MNTETEKQSAEVLDQLASKAYYDSAVKGFGLPNGSTVEDRMCTAIALIHSELSEAVEALRNGNPPSEKIPDFSQLEEEMADALIRILDFSGRHNLKIGKAVVYKMEYNKNRPHKHGKKF